MPLREETLCHASVKTDTERFNVSNECLGIRHRADSGRKQRTAIIGDYPTTSSHFTSLPVSASTEIL